MALSEEEIHNNLARFVKTEQAAHEYGTSNPNELYLELDNLRLRVINAIRKDPNKKGVQKGMYWVGTYLNFDIYLDESSQEPEIISQSKIQLKGKPTIIQQARLVHHSFTVKEGPKNPDGPFNPLSSFTLTPETPAPFLSFDNTRKIHEFIRGPLDLYLRRTAKLQ